MLQVQKYLLNHSLQQLETEHGVNHRFSADRSKFTLNYDQLTAKSDNTIACQCRGLVLRPLHEVLGEMYIVRETTIVSHPLDRFFNAGDVHAAPIDWDTAVIQEKLDGTCCILYYDFVKQQWCVATRAVPEADVSFGDIVSPLKQNTFYELFKHSVLETIRAKYCEFFCGDPTDLFDNLWCNTLDKNVTYVYELTSPYNRVVVKYDECRVTLLAARETATGRYIKCEEGYGPGLQVVETWPLKTLADIEHFLHDSDPAKIEGAVVIDANHNRLKVKSKQWVLASRMKDSVSMSKRNALESVIEGTIDDVIPLMNPDVQEYLRGLQWKTANYLLLLDNTFFELKHRPDRKSFALSVQASGLWQTPLFNLYSGKWSSTSEWLRDLARNKKLTASMLDTLLEVVE
jgi:hypothetical protein